MKLTNREGLFLPAKLREYAGLEKEIVFVGVLSKIEIWSKKRWEDNDDYDNIEDIAEDMSQFGTEFLMKGEKADGI